MKKVNVHKLVESKLFNKDDIKEDVISGIFTTYSDLTGADIYFDVREDENQIHLADNWLSVPASLDIKEVTQDMVNICAKYLNSMDAELKEFMSSNKITK